MPHLWCTGPLRTGTQMLPAEEKSDQPVRWFTKALRLLAQRENVNCKTTSSICEHLAFQKVYDSKERQAVSGMWLFDSSIRE